MYKWKVVLSKHEYGLVINRVWHKPDAPSTSKNWVKNKTNHDLLTILFNVESVQYYGLGYYQVWNWQIEPKSKKKLNFKNYIHEYDINHHFLLFQKLSRWKTASTRTLATKEAAPSKMAASQFAFAKQPDGSAVKLGKLTEIFTFVALILREQIIALEPRWQVSKEIAYSLILIDRFIIGQWALQNTKKETLTEYVYSMEDYECIAYYTRIVESIYRDQNIESRQTGSTTRKNGLGILNFVVWNWWDSVTKDNN